MWQPVLQRDAAQWHTPILDRSAMRDAEASKALQTKFSLLAVPDLATPIDAWSCLHYSYLASSRIAVLPGP